MHRINGTPSSQTSSTPAASTLRPRARRLISIDDELGVTSGSENDASPFGSRTPSPNARYRSSRPNVTSNPSSIAPVDGSFAPRAIRDTSATFSGLLGNSWSAIQGLASNVLGNEGDGAAPPENATRRRKPLWATHGRGNSSVAPKQWGPSKTLSSQIGVGAQEDRESMIRAMKRKDLLTGNDHTGLDSIGRIKRRNSDDRMSSSAPPGENEDRDALVYIHHVRPEDTLAGITIKFNCQPAVLRKANRMWPNDPIQTKKTIVLPVDACGVKGRPVAGPDAHEEDLLSPGDYSNPTNKTLDPYFSHNTSASHSLQNSENSLASSLSNSRADSEHTLKHDSWVLLPNNTEPTEICRMPRRTLGFFPPARRKSLAYSDASTPSPSLDLPRSSTSTCNPDAHTSSPNRSAAKGRPPTRSGSVSAPIGRHRSASNSFLLRGPGGVGTMGKNVRSPGPAEDSLNKLFASHLPNVAPPPGQEYFTPWAPSLLEADSGTSIQHGGSGAITPLGGPGMDLQEIGGAIEGWVRKMGSQASKLLSEPSTPGRGKRSAVPVLGAVGGDLGDLIELRDDAFEIGEDEDHLRGRSRADDTSGSSTQPYQSARPDFNLVMRDRGRKGGDGGKTD